MADYIDYHYSDYQYSDLNVSKSSFGSLNRTMSYNITPHVTDCIRHYAFYIITVFGCLSNLVILVVLLNSKRMRKSVSGVFLIAVAIADIIVLVTHQLDALILDHTYNGLGFNTYASCPSKYEMIPANSNLCSVIAYFKYVFRCLSTFIILDISIHRFVVMKFPLHFRKFSNLKSAIIQIVCMFVVSLIANVHATHFISTPFGCEPEDPGMYSKGVTIVIVAICDILGSLLIFVLSLWTVRIYIRAGKHFLQRQDSSSSQTRKDGERHMTKLLLTVALTFVFMRLPYTATWLPIWFELVPSTSPLHYVNNITKCIYLAKHAIKLYLYCLCSHGFREEFRTVMLYTRRSSVSSSAYRARSGTGSSATLNRTMVKTSV